MNNQMNFLNPKAYLIVLALLLLVLGGCSKAATNTETVANTTDTADAPKMTLTVAVATDPGIDQLDAGGYDGSMQLQPMIYDGLVDYGPKGEILPSLAESWDISEDGKVYTFHLREGVLFSDGTPFNAEVVRFSFERWVHDPANSLQVATALEAIETPDEHTVVLRFDKAYYPFLTELAFARPVRMISPSAVEPAGDSAGRFVEAIGTGLWIAESYERDRETVLVPNPHYWGKAPHLDRIVLKVIPDSQSRVLALQSGEVDIVGTQLGRLPIESLPVIEADAQLTLQRTAGTNSHFVIFNGSHPALQQLQVRQAINLAIDKKSIVDDLMDGIGSEAQGLFPLTVPYVTEQNQQWYSYDPAAAASLLAEAGYNDTDGDGIVEADGQPLTLRLVLQQAEFPEWKPIGELIQHELAAIGIDAQLQVLEPNAYYDTLWTTREYDMILYRTYDDAYNPHAFLQSLFHHTAEAPAVAWSDSELESLIQMALATTATDDRQKAYDAIFARMYEEAMFAAVYFPEELAAIQRHVEGFAFGDATFSPIRWGELKRGDR
ncbi:hypothetical protein PA598K_00435 [Paenibacillus sp. 598K]|uniref:ABC transporter substrate-binding protein n=1 Tax=Paenibacillus sp. 598K TaxID=1117987 RepID=UPI000FF9B143|nr:ABC transporter substrate-binding protein [Paenibacillus sp. 598K]GBF72198.1 hypothetical protein PA598K_00435 [Paenibacillus sp. 598K]